MSIELIRKWTDSIFTLPLPSPPVLFQPFDIRGKIVPQLVPNMLLLASEDIKQHVRMYVSGTDTYIRGRKHTVAMVNKLASAGH